MILDRRASLKAALAVLASPLVARTALADAAMSRITAYAFSFPALAGGDDIRLAGYTGHPFLVVNTASLCGYTPQYAGLQALWTEFHDRGLAIVGVPSNDFNQEPGGAKDIAETAERQYSVTFPIAAKAVVVGSNAHPFYRWAAQARPNDVPRWNFHKYLIGRDGYIADVFASAVEPTDTRVKTAIARALADS
jgi:glutathione peroxidase